MEATIQNPEPSISNAFSLFRSKGVIAISRITAILVILLAVAAFAMSFEALHDLAAKSGAIAPHFSFVFPLAVDGAIVVFSIGALRASLCGEPTKVPMLLVVSVTSLSVIFNISHAPFGLLSCVMAATPPLLLFLAFESLMTQLKSEIGRRGVIASIEELNRQYSEAIERLNILQAKERRLEDQITALSDEKKAKKSASKNGCGISVVTTEKERKERAAKVRAMNEGGAGNAEIARSLGVSAATVRRDLS